MTMTLSLPPKLQSALADQANRRGVPVEEIAVEALLRQLVPLDFVEPVDEWERRLFSAAIDCGVSVPNDALSSEGLYEQDEAFDTASR